MIIPRRDFFESKRRNAGKTSCRENFLPRIKTTGFPYILHGNNASFIKTLLNLLQIWKQKLNFQSPKKDIQTRNSETLSNK